LTTLQFYPRYDGAVLIVSVVGDLSIDTRSWLADFVEGMLGTGACVVVDLSDVRLCDATSMTMLILIADRCRDRGGWLRLTGVHDLVARAFAIVAFGRVVPIYATVEAAVTGNEADRIKD